MNASLFLKISVSKTTLFILTTLCMLSFQLAQAQGTQNIFTIPAANIPSPFIGSGNFNAIIFGNHLANSGDTEGRLAVGGSFTFTPPSASSYSIGLAAGTIGSANAPTNTDNFVVNANFGNNGNADWIIQGNFINQSTSGNPVAPNGTTTTGVTNHIVFSGNTLANHFKSISSTLDDHVNNSIVAYSEFSSPITITGTNNLNIADVTVPGDLINTGIDINMPTGATTVVNILNSTIRISGGDMRINGTGISGFTGWDRGSKVLFNFPNATSIILENFSLLGSFLAPQASLSVTGGSINGQSIIGGDMNQSGGFEFHNFDFTGDLSSAPLPVSLVDFNLVNSENRVQLAWQTTTESNSDFFDIERSSDAKNWKSIGHETSNNTGHKLSTYTFDDAYPQSGLNYYRLKMVDLDGTYAYSKIREINVSGQSDPVVGYPNPVSKDILNLYSDNWANVKAIQLVSIQGETISQSNVLNQQYINVRGLSRGVYFLKSTSLNGVENTQKIVVE